MSEIGGVTVGRRWFLHEPKIPQALQSLVSKLGRGQSSTPVHNHAPKAQHPQGDRLEVSSQNPANWARLLMHSFLRLANLESGAFGLLNRYEVALWRQTVQTIIALRAVRRRF